MRRAWGLLFALACGGDASTPKPSDPKPGDAEPSVPEPTDAGANVSDAEAGAGPSRYHMEACDVAPGPLAPLSTRCGHFVDDAGRVTLLHGVNARVEGVFDVTFDDGREPLEEIPAFGAEDALRMRELGFNLLRLPIHWSAIEPVDESPPRYDEEAFARIETVLDRCQQAGLWVLLDFHQDAYSKEIGEDGAPLWAIEPPPEMLLGGPLEDLAARRASGQVLAAFDTFMSDEEPGPTLRTRFSAMAAATATRFASHPSVIGYDLYNEPIGSDAEVLRLNRTVAEAIRAADPETLLFFEPPVVQRNVADRSGRPDAPFPVTGGVYAPHVYTLSFFGSETQRRNFTRRTLRGGNESARAEAALWETPLFIGEYGYDPFGIRAEDYFAFQTDLQDEYQASSALWLWKERSQGSWGLHDWDAETGTWQERPSLRRLIARPKPEAIAGWPEGWRLDRSARRLTLRYEGRGEITAQTLLYVPSEGYERFEVRCDGAKVDARRDPATGQVAVDCSGPGSHTVVLQGL